MVIKLRLFLALLMLPAISMLASQPTVYFIPGQGADSRLFEKLEIDSTYPVKHIEYFTPEKGWMMEDYARALSTQIDTLQPYILIGASLGGMLATEMSTFLSPEKTIVISSAKSREEFPFKYRFLKTVPIYKAFPKSAIKSGAKMMQPIYEPDSKNDSVFLAMLEDKDPAFLKRTIEMIMKWDNLESNPDIIHIHGDNDHTLPVKKVQYNYLVNGGSHMMVRTHADEISQLLNTILSEDEIVED